MPTSAHLPLAAALGLETLMASGGIFDVRVLGAVYSLCFLAALAGLLQLRRHSGRLGRQLLPAAVVLCFVNATYLPWFNSFYFDTASFVFLLMSVVAICRITVRGPSRSRDYALAAICVILFTTSKSQHSLLALAAIPCLWRPSAEASNATPLTRSTCCLIAVIAITWPWISVPLSYRTTGLYNALFYRALPHSSNREAALAEFGIGSEYLPHVGQHAFEPHSPLNDPTRALYLERRLTVPKMVLYYARHPGVTWHALLQALTEGSLLRARMTIGRNEFRLGNYAYATGYPPGSQSHFLDVWTTVKTALFAWRPRVYLGYMLGLLGTLWFLILRKPPYRKKQGALLCASLTSMIFLALFLVLFDGVDTGRHLFLFNSLLDICACAIVAVI